MTRLTGTYLQALPTPLRLYGIDHPRRSPSIPGAVFLSQYHRIVHERYSLFAIVIKSIRHAAVGRIDPNCYSTSHKRTQIAHVFQHGKLWPPKRCPRAAGWFKGVRRTQWQHTAAAVPAGSQTPNLHGMAASPTPVGYKGLPGHMQSVRTLALMLQ